MDPTRFLVSDAATLLDAVQVIQHNSCRAAIAVHDGRAVGVISDGDIMRSMLRGDDMRAPLKTCLRLNFKYLTERDLPRAMALMREHGISMVPVVDRDFKVVEVVTLKEVLAVCAVPEDAAMPQAPSAPALPDNQPSRAATPIDPKSVLAVIPARGGSKRVPRKNIAAVGGKPLLAWTVEAARGAGLDPAVSTEDDEIATAAAACGARVVRRPAELATDTASTEAALLHAVAQLDPSSRCTWVMTLPPTSPLRGADAIRRVLAAASSAGSDVDCVMTVTEFRGDLWRGAGGAPDGLRRLFPGAPRRQVDRMPLWDENSAVYLTRATALRSSGSVLGSGRIQGVPLGQDEGWDVNTAFELEVADALLARRTKR